MLNHKKYKGKYNIDNIKTKLQKTYLVSHYESGLIRDSRNYREWNNKSLDDVVFYRIYKRKKNNLKAPQVPVYQENF